MIRVAVPTRYNFDPKRSALARPDGLMWYAATQSTMIPPNSIKQMGIYTNEDALYEQIGAEFSYNGKQDESDFNLFPCRKQCKEELGGEKGTAFRQCLRECRGQGPKKSQLRGIEAETDAELADALKQISGDSGATERGAGEGTSSTWMWVIIAIMILAIIGVGIFMITRKKAEA